MRNRLINIILDAVNEINKTVEAKPSIELRENYPLFGSQGGMDSISLVSLIVTVEQHIEDEFAVSIILANEKAMSQRNSPFLTVGTLAQFSEKLIQQVTNHE